MGRALGVTKGGLVYHVLNRANRRALLFRGPGDYAAFLRVLAQGQSVHPIRLLAYCLMPGQRARCQEPFRLNVVFVTNPLKRRDQL